MTEKAKSSTNINTKVTTQLNPIQNEKSEIDKQFLERTNVKSI